MSLKGFHIVFVTVSSLLFLFLALWGFLLAAEPGALPTAMGVTGLIGLLVMPLYGVHFLRKARHINL